MYNLYIDNFYSYRVSGFDSWKDLAKELRERGGIKVGAGVWRLEDGSFAAQVEENLDNYLLTLEVV